MGRHNSRCGGTRQGGGEAQGRVVRQKAGSWGGTRQDGGEAQGRVVGKDLAE